MANETQSRTNIGSMSLNTCDESKCLSTGLMPVDGNGDEPIAANNPSLFNCYAQGPDTLYPYLCAEDFVGVEIPDETVGADLKYYTCCPPNQDSEIPPTRKCQDPQQAGPIESSSVDWSPTSACQADSPSFPYGRKMTQLAGFPITYMCCSEPLIGEGDGVGNSAPMGAMNVDGPTMNGDSVSEADPPNNSVGATMDGDPLLGSDSQSNNGLGSEGQKSSCQTFPCQNCTVENNFWDLQTMNCYNDYYQYPQVVNASGNTAVYECCSMPSEDGVDSSFLVTSPAYLATVWTQFILALIASLMASLLIASIGRSLYLADNKNNSNRNRNTRRNTNSDYSAYNLYLVFLAIPDLAYNLFMLGIVTEEFFNGWIPVNDLLITISATSNQYMNAIIAREVLILLRNTKDCKRYVPPSFKKSVIQFAAATAIATVFGFVWMYILHFSVDTSDVRATKAIPAEKISIPIFYLLVVILPGIYLIWVCFEIWHNDLLPKGEVTLGQHLRHQPGDATRCTEETSQPPSLRTISGKEMWISFRKAVSDRFLNNEASGPTDKRDNTSVTNLDVSFQHPSSYATNRNASNPTSRHNRSSPITSAETRGRLNVLAMYFFRIIAVFFFLWLPGMIMYYMGYETDRNASGALHNVALIFFSLQAIVSNGMAFTKPDVKKSIFDLWEEATKLLSCCRKPREEVSDTLSDLNIPTSQGNLAKEWPKADIEMPIREVSSGNFSAVSNPSVSDVVAVQHGITNIGGIQVAQLMTHTICSFDSTSRHSDDEIEIYAANSDDKFAYASTGDSDELKASASNICASGHSDDHGKSEERRTSLKRASLSKKKERRNSNSYPPVQSDEPPMTKTKSNKIKSPSGKPKKRRGSAKEVLDTDSSFAKWKDATSDGDIPFKNPPFEPKMQRRSSGSYLQTSASRGSTAPRRSSDSNIQGRRGSGSHATSIGVMKLPGARTAQRRGSGSHLCKLNASNVPSAQVIIHSHSNDNRGGESPVTQLRKKFDVSDSNTSSTPIQSPQSKRHAASINISNTSPVAELRKKFEQGNDCESRSPVLSPRSRKKVANISIANASPVTEREKEFNHRNNEKGGMSKRADKSPGASTKRRMSASDINVSGTSKGKGKSKRRNSDTMSDYKKKSPGKSRKKRLSDSDIKVSGVSKGESKRRNSDTMNRHAKKSPGNKPRRLSGSHNDGEVPDRVNKRSMGTMDVLEFLEMKVGEPPLGEVKQTNKANTNVPGRHISDSSASTSTSTYASTKGRGKRSSNIKTLSFDGTVTDHSMAS